MLRLPTDIQFEITGACNLRCRHCYRFDTENMPAVEEIREEDKIRLIQKLIDAQVYSLVITGGEPFVQPDITIRAVEMTRKAGMSVSINTNLLLLTPEIVLTLKKLELNSILISCPASDPRVYRQITRGGDYRRFRRNLELWLASGIPCLVNMVATKDNFSFIRSTAMEMADLGVKKFAVTPASLNVEHPDLEGLLSGSQIISLLEDLRWCSESLGLAVDVLEVLPKCFLPAWCWEKKYAFMRRSCQAGRMSVSISNLGNVRPCSHNPVSFGNLFEESLETIWGKMSKYRDDSIPAVCQKCPAISSCNGGCRMNALAMTGSLSELDRLATGPIQLPNEKQEEIALRDDSLLSFKGKLKWRKEIGNEYSIASKKSRRNIIVVNEEMFKFV
jgi:radical SAM protein with 4Fe4S-binding SPASM domain